MIAKRVPRQLRDQAVVLMRIASAVSEDDPARLLSSVPRDGLHFRSDERHEAVGKGLQERAVKTRRADKQLGGLSRLAFSHSDGAEDDPVKLTLGILSRKRRIVPPQPISMSSEWQPRQRTVSVLAPALPDSTESLVLHGSCC